MLEYLDKLRMKPRHVRERIALGVTTVFSLFIAIVWWGSWGARTSVNEATVSNELSPVSVAVDMVGRAKDSTATLLGEFARQAQTNASGTAAVAQVGDSFKDDNKESAVVSVGDIMDNTIRTESNTATSVATTSVE